MTKKAKSEQIAQTIYDYYKAQGIESNCLASFEKIVIEFAQKETIQAINDGFKFSASRFNPVFNATMSMIRNAYSLYIKECYS